MYAELHQYLILYKQLNVPGIGVFQLERKPAEADFASKLITAPTYSISLHHGNSNPSKKLYSWLSAAMGITERDAVIRFNDFAFELKDRVMAGNKLEWEGVGSFTKGLAGEIRFETSVKDQPEGPSIPAVKVLRERAEHTVRVGEDEKTSAEMIEYLHAPEDKKSWYWVAAWILLIISFIFVGYYFSVHGLSSSSAGNQQQLTPVPAAPVQAGSR